MFYLPANIIAFKFNFIFVKELEALIYQNIRTSNISWQPELGSPEKKMT